MAAARPRILQRERLGAAIVLGAAALLWTGGAAGQTPEELAAARQTFVEGKDLEKKNQWADALEKFKKVAAVKMTPQVRFHIALCEENLGKLVSAMKGFDLAAEEARQAGSSAVEVANNAPGRADALRARVATLRIEVTGKLEKSKIVLDEVTLGASAIGTALPIDPGAHVLEVRDASGKTTFKKEITLAEKGMEKVEITVDDSEPAPPPKGDPPPPPPPPPSRAPVWAVGAVGVASLATSGLFLALRANTISEILDNCSKPATFSGCKKSDEATAANGRLYQTLSGVFLGVGAAGVGAATVLYFVLSPKKAPAPPAKASVQVIPTGTGFEVRGAF